MKSPAKMWMPVVCLFAALTMTAVAAAQDTPTQDNRTDDHDRGPGNGDLAVSAVTVIDDAYGTNQIATLPKHGGPYHFLTDVTRVPNGAFDPDFTPDGKTVFFWTLDIETPGHPDFAASVPARGGPITPIHTSCSDDPNCLAEDHPAISPDGRHLLLVRTVNNTDPNECFYVGIFEFRLDGSHARQLTPTLPPPCSGDGEPRWSPDGEWIVVQHGLATGETFLWIMRRDGSHRHQVGKVTDIGNPNWSPDGRLIVFQSPAEPADDQHPQQVYTIHPDGTHLRQITHSAPILGVVIGNFGSRWSPDGKKLVFSHRDPYTTVGPDGQPHADLFEMNPDGSDVVQINSTPEKDNNPAWGARR